MTRFALWIAGGLQGPANSRPLYKSPHTLQARSEVQPAVPFDAQVCGALLPFADVSADCLSPRIRQVQVTNKRDSAIAAQEIAAFN
jgi:hypothetical protein